MDFYYNVSRRHLIMIKNPSNCKTAVEMRNALIEARDDTERVIENITYWVEGLNQMIEQFDRTIDVNVKAQRTPVLVKCSEKEKLTLTNLYKEYDGNQPVIFAYDSLNTDAISSINTGAPFVADKIYQLKVQYWNEILTYLGISNINTQKKERMVTDEVTRNQGGVVASRYSRLGMRQKACKEINKMFGLDISVDFREDFQEVVERVTGEVLGKGEGEDE